MQYSSTQANPVGVLPINKVGGLSDLQSSLDYPLVRGASYMRRDSNFTDVGDADTAIENLFDMATIHLPVVEEQLRQSQEVIDNLLIETRVLTTLINEGLDVQEDLDQLRIDEAEEDILEYSI